MTQPRQAFRDDSRPPRYQSPFGEQRGTQYRVLCSDGVVRTATATAEADSFFTVPARVSVRGRTVTGHVFARSEAVDDRPGPRYAFASYTYRRNGHLLPH